MKNEKELFGETKKIATLAKKTGISLWQAQGISSYYLQKSTGTRICVGLPCAMHHSSSDQITSEIRENGNETASCLGYCDHAPVISKNGKYYNVKDKPVLIEESVRKNTDNLEDEFLSYSKGDGFLVLEKTLAENDSSSVIDLIQKWALRGMGGAGFPTYMKWKAVSDSDPSHRYLVVNAHEGEPGTFKDRIIMETRPYDLLQAAIMTAEVIGSKHVIIALKWEYLNAESVLKKALSIMLSHLKVAMPALSPPEIRIMRIPGYYVTGEETALLEAIEGNRSEPRLRPPYPAESGLFGAPTLIDNVETLVFLLDMLHHHYNNDSSTGEKKAYCLTGDVSKPGAYFENYGIKADDLLQRSGGTSAQKLKALLPGGLSGGILPASLSGTKLDFDSVRATGAGLGTGSMIAISKDRCMVQVLNSIESFFARESCGKCIPCRIGTEELNKVLTNLQNGDATIKDLQTAEKDAMTMITGSICGLGQAAGRMFLDGVKHFKSEIEGHANRICATGTCFHGVS